MEFQHKEDISPDRLFGVTLDGRHIIFVTHNGHDFEVSDRYQITAESITPLLRALISIGARGSSFTPDNLVREFGAKNATAAECIRLLYEALELAQSPKAKTLFGQWKLMFSEVCGYNLNSTNDHIAELGAQYGIAKPKAAHRLFALHSYYAVFIKLLAAEICSALSPIPTSVIRRCHDAVTSDALHNELTDLENGGIWAQIGIRNFLEGDIFSWYISEWNTQISSSIRKLLSRTHYIRRDHLKRRPRSKPRPAKEALSEPVVQSGQARSR